MPKISVTEPASSTLPSMELPISLQYRRGKKSLQKELVNRILHSDLFEAAAQQLPPVILWDNARDLSPQQKLALLKRASVPRMSGLQNRAGLPVLYRDALLHRHKKRETLIRQSMDKGNENCSPELVEQNVRAIEMRKAHIDWYTAINEVEEDTPYKSEAEKLQLIDSGLDKALINSATNGLTDSLKNMVRLGANLEATDQEHYFTALQFAARRGDLDAVLFLVRAGANVNVGLYRLVVNFLSPVFLAIEQGHVDVVIHLLELGAVDKHRGCSVLHYAAKCGHASVVLALLDYGYAINEFSSMGPNPPLDFIATTPLHEAASRGHVELLKILIQRDADPSQRDSFGYSALHYAVKSQSIPSIEFLFHTAGLMDEGCSESPLHVATSERPNLEVVELLIRFGCKVNARDYNGNTPLLNLVAGLDRDTGEYLPIVQRLLDLGAEVNVASYGGTTPLHHAAREGGNAVVELLLTHEANPHAVDHDGCTPLHYAASFADVPMISALIQREAAVNVSDHHNMTPLHYAVDACIERGDFGQIRCLLEAGADPLQKAYRGMTPLHFAAEADCIESINALIHGRSPAELHAMLSQENEDGETPFALARDDEVRDLLEIQEIAPCEDD